NANGSLCDVSLQIRRSAHGPIVAERDGAPIVADHKGEPRIAIVDWEAFPSQKTVTDSLCGRFGASRRCRAPRCPRQAVVCHYSKVSGVLSSVAGRGQARMRALSVLSPALPPSCRG